MGSNPLNLALRFVLELTALIAMGSWGWNTGEGALQYVLAPALPLIAATAWGTFAVLGDPSRSGRAPVPVPGMIRLALELAFFAFATWALLDTGKTQLAWVMGFAVLFHYLISYDRLAWLIKQ